MKVTTGASSKIENDIIINEKWKIIKKLGSGSFGSVFLSKELNSDKFVAIKMEKIEKKEGKEVNCSLYMETLFLTKLKDVTGIPQLKWNGENDGYECIVIDLLGRDLGSILRHYKTFTIKTTSMIAIQAIEIIQNIHEKSILHRDLKPDNMAPGVHTESNQIFIYDFGISKIYKDGNGNLIPRREFKPFIGTTRYASIAAHKGCEQSRKDDLESLGYIIVYFLKGSLPWQNIQTDSDKTQKVGNMKMTLSIENLCIGLPHEVKDFFIYVKSLNYLDSPDYKYLANLFTQLLKKEGAEVDWIWDWSKKRKSKNSLEINGNMKPLLGNMLNVKDNYSKSNLNVSGSFSKIPSYSMNSSVLLNEKSYQLKSQLKSSVYGLGPQMIPSNLENLMYQLESTKVLPLNFHLI